jgi:hypothetical protein
MDIKATDIKTLREKTGAGMMDCKKAWSRPKAISPPRKSFCASGEWRG